MTRGRSSSRRGVKVAAPGASSSAIAISRALPHSTGKGPMRASTSPIAARPPGSPLTPDLDAVSLAVPGAVCQAGLAQRGLLDLLRGRLGHDVDALEVARHHEVGQPLCEVFDECHEV